MISNIKQSEIPWLPLEPLHYHDSDPNNLFLVIWSSRVPSTPSTHNIALETPRLAYYSREKALDMTRGVSLLCMKITVFNLTSPSRTRCDPLAGRGWTIPYKSAPFTIKLNIFCRLQERAKWKEIRSVEFIKAVVVQWLQHQPRVRC